MLPATRGQPITHCIHQNGLQATSRFEMWVCYLYRLPAPSVTVVPHQNTFRIQQRSFKRIVFVVHVPKFVPPKRVFDKHARQVASDTCDGKIIQSRIKKIIKSFNQKQFTFLILDPRRVLHAAPGTEGAGTVAGCKPHALHRTSHITIVGANGY